MATFGDSVAAFGDAVIQFDGFVDRLEIRVSNARYNSEGFVASGEIDAVNTAANDAADGVTSFAFDGCETHSRMSDNTPSS
jgi:hypothetical protein